MTADHPATPTPTDAPAADAGALALARGFAAQVARWSARTGAGPDAIAAARRAAQAASLAAAAGHTCVPLADALPDDDPPAARALLRASGVVATLPAPAALPLVIDEDDRLYLHRDHDHERRLAQRLLHFARATPTAPDPAAARRLQSLFDAIAAPHAAAAPADAADPQRIAAALALHRRLAVVSGGPGTGKTTLVAVVLACLLEREPDARIVLAAPTGKAAARLVDALSARAGALPCELRERLPTEAHTLHRLLGASPRGGWRHHAGHPLPLDVLVVDEASMLDLALAARLFDAIPDTARVLLLGDKDQLASVEAGAVFADVSADPALGPATREAVAELCGVPAARLQAPAGPTTPLADSTVWLTRTHRFAKDSPIGALAAAINAGDAAAVAALLKPGPGPTLVHLADDDALADHVRDGYAPFIDAVRTGARDVAAVSRAFDRFRVLCAVRDGPRGVQALNRLCESWLRAGSAPWYPGRAVIVTRNEPLLQLYNGDVGIALPDAEGRLMVHFPAPGNTWRALAPARLPEHETAFAITVHKAQGSEFDRVAVILPARRSPVVTRELLYTGVTRARSQVALCADPTSLLQAVASRTARRSGLASRLRDAATSG